MGEPQPSAGGPQVPAGLGTVGAVARSWLPRRLRACPSAGLDGCASTAKRPMNCQPPPASARSNRIWHDACCIKGDDDGDGPGSGSERRRGASSRRVRKWTPGVQSRTGRRAHGCKWRPEPESNRRARICSPLRNHSAIGPGSEGVFAATFTLRSSPPLQLSPFR